MTDAGPELWTEWQLVPGMLRVYRRAAFGIEVLQQQWRRDGYADGRWDAAEYEWRNVPIYVDRSEA